MTKRSNIKFYRRWANHIQNWRPKRPWRSIFKKLNYLGAGSYEVIWCQKGSDMLFYKKWVIHLEKWCLWRLLSEHVKTFGFEVKWGHLMLKEVKFQILQTSGELWSLSKKSQHILVRGQMRSFGVKRGQISNFIDRRWGNYISKWRLRPLFSIMALGPYKTSIRMRF